MVFNLNEYFCPVPGSEKEKEIIIFAHRHWISFLGGIIISGMLLIVPMAVLIVARIYLPDVFQGKFLNFLVVFGCVYYLAIVMSIFNAWISYYYDIYILTTDLLIDVTQQGFFNRKISQLSLLRVQDVSSNIKGFFPTLFAYGDVLVETAGEGAENFLLCSIPNPQAFSAKVIETHDLLIEKEGLQKQISEGEGLIRPNSISEDESHAPAGLPNDVTISDKVNPPTVAQPPKEEIIVPENTHSLSKKEGDEGEMNKNDLDQGGEVKL